MMSSRDSAPSPWGWGAGAWGWGADEADPMGELVGRLSADYASLVGADVVIAIVQQCFLDLDATPPPSPAAVERLARQRLNEAAGAYAISGVTGAGPAAGSSAYVIIKLLYE